MFFSKDTIINFGLPPHFSRALHFSKVLAESGALLHFFSPYYHQYPPFMVKRYPECWMLTTRTTSTCIYNNLEIEFS